LHFACIKREKNEKRREKKGRFVTTLSATRHKTLSITSPPKCLNIETLPK